VEDIVVVGAQGGHVVRHGERDSARTLHLGKVALLDALERTVRRVVGDRATHPE
jgi:aminoglycoside N3'-acetyltransferase